MFVFRGHVPEPIYARHSRRRAHRPCAMFLIATLLSLTAQAQQRVPLTLAEAEDLALKNEPGHEALLANASALNERATAAAQLPDPVLRAGLANFPVSSGGFSTEAMTQAQLGIRQVFPPGRSRAIDSVRIASMATEFRDNAEARTRDVLMATRTAWLETYYWQKAQQIVRASRPFFADLVNITRSMYAVGRKSQHDVLSAELELSRLDDRLIEAGRATAEAQAGLSRWLGADAYRPVAMKLPSWSDPVSLEGLHRALLEHPQLAAADARIQAKELGVDLARESYKSGWALDLGYGFRDGLLPNGEPRSDFVSLSVSVDLPFFRKNRQDRSLASAFGERRAAAEKKRELQARLRSQLDLHHARWADLTRRLALYENQILDQSASQAETALLAYQSDTGAFSDVMRGYIDDLNTRLDYIRLQVERAQSHAVLANLGGLPR